LSSAAQHLEFITYEDQPQGSLASGKLEHGLGISKATWDLKVGAFKCHLSVLPYACVTQQGGVSDLAEVEQELLKGSKDSATAGGLLGERRVWK